jgi:hypothetical protein
LFGDKGEQVRHAVVGLLQLVEREIDAGLDAERRKIKSFLEDGIELYELVPMSVLRVCADQRGWVGQFEEGGHFDHRL